MKMKANFQYKPGNFQMDDCQIEKVVDLSYEEFYKLKITPGERQTCVIENKRYMFSKDGIMHCLLALGQGSNDGILIEAEGYDYPHYAAYIPGMRDIVNAEMDRIADFIVRQAVENTTSGSWCVYFEELEEKLGLTIREGNGFDSMLRLALKRRAEIAAVDMHDGCIETEYRCLERQCSEQPTQGAGSIQILKIEPGKTPETVTIPNTLEAFQAAVGGYIEVVGLDANAALVCNETGKLTGLPDNRQVGADTIAGTFLIVGIEDGDFCSLSDEDAAYYAERFAQPMPAFNKPDEPTQWEFHVL